MGYPFDKTYLEQIQDSPDECEHIKEAYYVLLGKYMRENDISDDIDLNMSQRLAILGDAFDNESWTIRDISDSYHFMGDLLETLLTPKEKNGQ